VNLLLFLTNSGQKSLTMLISSFLTTIQLIFKNIGFEPATTGVEAKEHLRNSKENYRKRR